MTSQGRGSCGMGAVVARLLRVASVDTCACICGFGYAWRVAVFHADIYGVHHAYYIHITRVTCVVYNITLSL